MIKLEMNHSLFFVIQEEIYEALFCNTMCGNEIGSEPIYRKDFFGRILPKITITLDEEDGHNVFKYTTLLSEEDFITLYNEIIWDEHEGFGAIKYDWYRRDVKKLCSYLIEVKNEYNLKSTLDDFKNLLWFMEE